MRLAVMAALVMLPSAAMAQGIDANGWTLTNPTLVGPILGTEASAPATPAAGKVVLYAKTGAPGVFCSKDDAGVETCMGGGGGGGGGNSVDVAVTVTSNQPNPEPIVVTGQAWVGIASEIVCFPFGDTTGGMTPGLVAVSGIRLTASDRVAGVGFSIHTHSPNGLEGTIRAHCLGI